MSTQPLPTTPAGMNARVANIFKEMESERKQNEEKALSERTQLAIDMQAAGVNHVTIRFYGGGDSGSVEDVKIEMADGFSEPEDLKNRLEQWAYTFLEGTGIDWYNNDGGQGELSFDLTKVPPAFSGNVDVNRTVSETAWSTEDEMA